MPPDLPWRLRVRNRGENQDFDKWFPYPENANVYVQDKCVKGTHKFYLAYLYETVNGVEHYRGEYDSNGYFTPAI